MVSCFTRDNQQHAFKQIHPFFPNIIGANPSIYIFHVHSFKVAHI
jgi:hypothetical protein